MQERTSWTSADSPLRIAEVRPGPETGRIGITLCPGKVARSAWTGVKWERDLATDLDVVRDWNAAAVVTLITASEMKRFGVEGMGEAVADRHLAWWHLPIRDMTPPGPDFEERWETAGPALRRLLDFGFDILVHCRGGLGRAGTVAARLLVEMGEGPEAAMDRVRRARSRHAIERGCQERHLRSVRPPRETAPSRSAAAVRDRALGALLGLAVGDAVGTTLEFAARDTRPRLTDMVGGGPFGQPAGHWTDDTSMALALAESLAGRDAVDAADLMDRFVAWWREGEYTPAFTCFDIGNTIRAALDRYLRSGDPFAGSTDPQTAGNGSLMRLAPVALRFLHDREGLDRAAAEQSRTTHATAEAVDACRAFAVLLAEAIHGDPAREVLRRREFEGASAVARILGGSWRGKPRAEIESSGYVIHTLEAALWSVARTSDFRGAILLAANLGRDADTTAAVAGQLAGALYGLEGIPAEWRRRLAWRDRLLDVGGRLLGD